MASCSARRQQKSPDSSEASQLQEEVDELSLVDHNETMARLTLKQEVGGSLPSLAWLVLESDVMGFTTEPKECVPRASHLL